MTLPPELRALLAGCDEVQREAITSSDEPILVLAGAGSGKTRVLTRRIAWRIQTRSAAARHVLALTFTRKAANELRGRLGELGVPSPATAGTFHAVALAQLRRLAADRHRTAPSLLDSKARLLGRVVPEREPAPAGVTRRELLSLLAGEIEWAKARLIAPEAYAAESHAARRSCVLAPELVVRAYRGYETEKRRRHVLDFDDLLVEFTAEILRDPDLAAAQRWRFRHVFVDELQDANPAQIHLLDAWLGGRSDLFAVGDPRQAIYGWNGADTAAIDGFETRYPGATVLNLETNYRSTPQVVALASAVLDEGGTGARAVRPDGLVPSIHAYADDRAEADAIATQIRRRRGPAQTLAEFAVLARTNAQLRVIAEALERAGLASRTGGGAAFLERPAVAAVLEQLPSRSDPGRFSAWLDDLALTLRAGTPSDEDEGERDESGPERASAERAELGALVRLGRDYLDLDPSARADGFLAFVRDTLRAEPSPAAVDAVELVTFHRAKGLEWPVVFVSGLEDGLVPIARAQTSAALAEERRLLYVALTRAEEELHCSWARERTFGTRRYRRDPSPYLASLDETRLRLESESTVDVTTARRGLAESRARLERAPLSRDPPARINATATALPRHNRTVPGPSWTPAVGVLGDDLTGTADAAGGFAGLGFTVVVARGAAAGTSPPVEVLAVSTHSRDVGAAAATVRVREGLDALLARPVPRLVKKVDSTLRGHLALELELARSAFSPELTIVAPAFPAQGRRVLLGRLVLDGDGPRARVADAFGLAPSAHTEVRLADLRAGGLERWTRGAHGKADVLVCDAESDDDLDRIVAEANATGARTLLVGSAGLAHGLARALAPVPADPDRAALPAREGSLVLAIGSFNPRATVQLAALCASADLDDVRVEAGRAGAVGHLRELEGRLDASLDAGRDVVLRVAGPLAPERAVEIEGALGRLLAARLGRSAGLVLSGGATAEAVLDAAGVGTLVLTGEVETGVPLGYSPDHGLPIVMKAGGFGDDDVLTRCLSLLRRHRDETRMTR